MNHFPSKETTARGTISRLSGSALGRTVAEQLYWGGNQFQGHSYHTPLSPKHPLKVNDIGPPLPLTMEVIITPH